MKTVSMDQYTHKISAIERLIVMQDSNDMCDEPQHSSINSRLRSKLCSSNIRCRLIGIHASISSRHDSIHQVWIRPRPLNLHVEGRALSQDEDTNTIRVS